MILKTMMKKRDAVWREDLGLWSTEEQDVIDMVDQELYKFTEERRKTATDSLVTKYMWDSDSGSIDSWHKYCQKRMRDNFHPLDEKIIFGDTETTKTDYASKKLSYPLRECDISGYEKLISTLYTPEERHKIEWAIGSVIEGDSKYIQKFLVLYGSAGTGKSTILNIIQRLFEGYYSVFDAKALGSSSNSFALEAFKSNPMVAIQHDGDLSRIEDNTRLNSLVSHELMTVNEKFKSTYANKFNAFLFMGTNKPVKITDSKSGLLRRLIDVMPSGKKLDQNSFMGEQDVEKLYNLRPVYFKYKPGYLREGDQDCERIIPGFYAELVEKYFPEAVRYDEKKRVADWDPKKLVPAMLKLIQLQKEQLDRQEERLSKIESILNIKEE